MWCRIVWLEGDIEVEGVVPDSWYNEEKSLIWWPPVVNAEKFIKEQREPNPANWKTFPIVKMKLRSGSFEECDLCPITTADETDDEDVCSGKRSKKKKNYDGFMLESEAPTDKSSPDGKVSSKARQSCTDKSVTSVPILPIPPTKMKDADCTKLSKTTSDRNNTSERSKSSTPTCTLDTKLSKTTSTRNNTLDSRKLSKTTLDRNNTSERSKSLTSTCTSDSKLSKTTSTRNNTSDSRTLSKTTLERSKSSTSTSDSKLSKTTSTRNNTSDSRTLSKTTLERSKSSTSTSDRSRSSTCTYILDRSNTSDRMNTSDRSKSSCTSDRSKMSKSSFLHMSRSSLTSTPKNLYPQRSRSRSLSRSPIIMYPPRSTNRASRRSRSRSLSRRSRSPMVSRRPRSPMVSRRSGSLMVSRRSRSPMVSRRSRSPMVSRRSRSPISMVSRRSRSPMVSRRSRSPMVSRRSRSPMVSRRSRSPSRISSRSRRSSSRISGSSSIISSSSRRSRSHSRTRSRRSRSLDSSRRSSRSRSAESIFPMTVAKYQKTALRLLVENRRLLKQLIRTKEVEPEFLVDNFDNLMSLNNFEEDLKNQETRNKLTNKLMSVGGVDLKDGVRNMLRRVMTNDLMSKFNISGHRGKIAFQDYTLYRVIKDVAIRAFNGSEKEVKDTIARTLKYAPDRAGGGGRNK